MKIDCRFASIEAVELGAHGDSGAAVLFDGWDGCRVVGELHFNGASFGNLMLYFKADEYLNIFLTNIEFVLRSNNLIVEIIDGSSQF